MFYKAVYSVLNGETDAATALKNLAQDYKDLLGFPIVTQ